MDQGQDGEDQWDEEGQAQRQDQRYDPPQLGRLAGPSRSRHRAMPSSSVAAYDTQAYGAGPTTGPEGSGQNMTRALLQSFLRYSWWRRDWTPPSRHITTPLNSNSSMSPGPSLSYPSSAAAFIPQQTPAEFIPPSQAVLPSTSPPGPVPNAWLFTPPPGSNHQAFIAFQAPPATQTFTTPGAPAFMSPAAFDSGFWSLPSGMRPDASLQVGSTPNMGLTPLAHPYSSPKSQLQMASRSPKENEPMDLSPSATPVPTFSIRPPPGFGFRGPPLQGYPLNPAPYPGPSQPPASSDFHPQRQQARPPYLEPPPRPRCLCISLAFCNCDFKDLHASQFSNNYAPLPPEPSSLRLSPPNLMPTNYQPLVLAPQQQSFNPFGGPPQQFVPNYATPNSVPGIFQEGAQFTQAQTGTSSLSYQQGLVSCAQVPLQNYPADLRNYEDDDDDEVLRLSCTAYQDISLNPA